jgi:hypothetical protein
MKLTVGPLPPAVYWRRRAVVLGAALSVVFLVAYSCGGAKASDASNTRTPNAGRSAATTGPQPGPSATSAPPLLIPTTGTPPPSDPAAETSTTPFASAATGQCTDAEMSVLPIPEAASVRQGTSLKITLRIKNISNRTCSRDVGASAQELFIQQGTTKMWSSDACDALTGSAVRVFPPSVEIEAYVVWNGHATSQGCINRPWAPVGAYQVFGRLGTKLSDPVPLQITA